MSRHFSKWIHQIVVNIGLNGNLKGSDYRGKVTRGSVLLFIMTSGILLSSCFYYGSDGNSTPSVQSPESPTSMYSPEIGHGIGITYGCLNGWKAFNQSDVNAAAGGKAAFPYWWLLGPYSNRNSYGVGNGGSYQFGVQQAEAAFACQGQVQSQNNIKGLTLFADVEGNIYGWATSSNSPNYIQYNAHVIQGFLDTVSASWDVSPGLYEGLYFYKKYTPGFQWSTLHDPSLPFVWWEAGADCNEDPSLTVPATLQPASSYQSMFTARVNDNNDGKCTNGGNPISLWQYYINGPDYDITTQNLSNQTATRSSYFSGTTDTGEYWNTSSPSS